MWVNDGGGGGIDGGAFGGGMRFDGGAMQILKVWMQDRSEENRNRRTFSTSP